MIVHLDADAFFASVEQAADPKLRGRPVAVGGTARGVVTSASYEARKLGIYSTMPTARARKICPRLVVVPGDFEKYERFSRFMFSYAYDFTPTVEVASIDEGYFDLRGNRKSSAREIAEVIRTAIGQSLKISVSEGIASNKLVSAVASKLRKPSCFLEVASGGERDFLRPLETKWLPGVGPQMAKTLNQAGLVRIGQLAEVRPEQLSLFAGKGARQLWEFAHGIDERPVISEPPAAKSYSEQETFEQDVTDEDWILAKLRSTADRLLAKVRGEGKAIRTVEVRVRYNDFDECRRSESLNEPTDLETEVYPALYRLLKKAWERRVSLRLVSVKVSGVYDGVFQAGLPLVNAGVDTAQQRRAAVAVDRLRARYGAGAVMRGHDLFLQHYGKAVERPPATIIRKKAKIEWAALNCRSGYSFLDSLLMPEHVVRLAVERGCRAVALTDPNLHGAVEFFIAAKDAGIKPVIGAEIAVGKVPYCAYVRDRTGYVNLLTSSSPNTASTPPLSGGSTRFVGAQRLRTSRRRWEYQVRRMTERIPWTSASHVEEAVAYSQECRDGTFEEDPYKTALRLAHRLDGFPRHPKMHPCGVVLSRLPVTHLSPVFTSAKGYPTTHFDMEQVEAIGVVKIDILAQAGLAVMRDTKELLLKRGITVDLKALEPWDDKEVWRMIASGNARGVHHIESPAMCTLERMVNVNNIDDLIAIVSVIRPGAANSMRKESFANRAQGIEPVEYAHPSLEPVLRSTYGVIAYEEHILQICEAFAGMTAGRADFLRRALVKIQPEKVQAMQGEFVSAAKERGRTDAEIGAVWKLLIGFMGYAFCRAHSTAYGVEAYEAAHLKRYYPAEFLSCVITHGKGFYSRLVYSLECRRLGIGFLLPDVNLSTDAYFPERRFIRVPVCQISGIGAVTLERWRAGKPFESLRDFYLRVRPSTDEMNNLIRIGAFDSFGESRTAQFWEFRELAQWPQVAGQGLLLGGEKPVLPDVPLSEPDRTELLKAETELLGFAVSGHPLDLYSDVQWNTYCPIADVGNYPTRRVTVAGMIIEDRLHHQMDGRIMKFISICDYSGILECELFASAYRRFGVETIRHPIVEVSGKVKPFANSNGYTLQVEVVRRARTLRYT